MWDPTIVNTLWLLFLSRPFRFTLQFQFCLLHILNGKEPFYLWHGRKNMLALHLWNASELVIWMAFLEILAHKLRNWGTTLLGLEHNKKKPIMNVSSLSVSKVEITTVSGVNETACSPAITFYLCRYCYPFVPAVPRPSSLFHLYFFSFPFFAMGGSLFERHSLYTQSIYLPFHYAVQNGAMTFRVSTRRPASKLPTWRDKGMC